jgi:hypothetical protein
VQTAGTPPYTVTNTGGVGTSGYTTGGAGIGTTVNQSGGFTQPALSGTVTVTVASTTGMQQNTVVYVAGGGDYQVTSVVSSTSVTLENYGSKGNAAVGANIPNGSVVEEAGGIGGNTGTSANDGGGGGGGGGLADGAAGGGNESGSSGGGGGGGAAYTGGTSTDTVSVSSASNGGGGAGGAIATAGSAGSATFNFAGGKARLVSSSAT